MFSATPTPMSLVFPRLDLQLDIGSLLWAVIAPLKSKAEVARALARVGCSRRAVAGAPWCRIEFLEEGIGLSAVSQGLLDSLGLPMGCRSFPGPYWSSRGLRGPAGTSPGLPRRTGGLSGAARLGEGRRWEASRVDILL